MIVDPLRLQALPGPESLPTTRTVDNVVWVAGRGPKPSRVMVVGQNPGAEELKEKRPFVGRSGQLLNEVMSQTGLSQLTPYITNAVKYGTRDNAKPGRGDVKQCQRVLLQEINEVNPELIVILGATALEAIAPGYKLSGGKGTEVKGIFFTVDELPGVTLYAAWHPAYILRNQTQRPQFVKDIQAAVNWLLGKPIVQGIGPYTLVTHHNQLMTYLQGAVGRSPEKRVLLSLDCEWAGESAIHPGAYLRTLQLHDGVETAVIRFYPVNPDLKSVDPAKLYPDCAHLQTCLDVLRVFFANVEVGLVGHNIKADGMWLYRLGLDIREYTHYDTMLAEHLINSLGPFGLTDLTLKYTSMGRYDEYVVKWKHNHKDLAVDGYGAIPDEFLLPYSAGDVQATWQVMVAQQPAMGRYYAPRGLQQEYPPLATSTLHMCSMLYEMEANGLTVDRSRLQELTKLYNDKRRELLAAFPAMVVPYGYTDFNPGSPVQVAKLLFNPTNANGLGLLPIKATGKPAKSWEWVLDQNPEVRKQYAPSTDSATLEILETKHPLVRQILNMRRINKACEAYLREDELGGIPGNIWADGRLHAGFGQLTDTGRLNSHNPNVQNFPKSSEGYILEIFGKGIAIPPTRSVIVADPLCVLFEADYAQAELFILAALADDEVMMGALTTPGKDLHDLTAISAFQLQVFMPDGSAANEEYLLRLAAADPAAYGKLLKELVYVDQKGKRMTRSEFKDTIRVSAKSINFGIPYGRGAAAIALQVKAETGLPIAESEVAAGIRKWKETYSQAWKCLCWYQAHGLKNKYVESPWGRRRYFNHPEFEYEKAGLQREAGNFPIQSTVADTMAIAADRIVQERARRKLKFTFRNQVHDSFLFNVPTTEVAAAREVIREGMGGIRIPMPSGKPLTLGVDIDVYERWSEKQKD